MDSFGKTKSEANPKYSFSQQETKRYKVELVRKIQQKVAVVLETMPVNEPSWQGTYRILVDKYKVYYSFSEDKRICYIEALRHQHQQMDWTYCRE